MLNWLANKLLNWIIIHILLSYLLISNKDIFKWFINVGDTQTILSAIEPIVVEFVYVIMVVDDTQMICVNYLFILRVNGIS